LAESNSHPTKVSNRNEGLERQEGKTKELRHRRPSSLTKPSHRELRQVATKMGWTICDHREIKTRVISPFRLRGKNDGAFMEFRQPSPFLHLATFVKNKGLMSYNRDFVVELSHRKFTFQGPYTFPHKMKRRPKQFMQHTLKIKGAWPLLKNEASLFHRNTPLKEKGFDIRWKTKFRCFTNRKHILKRKEVWPSLKNEASV
jgi:hypothetical protein